MPGGAEGEEEEEEEPEILDQQRAWRGSTVKKEAEGQTSNTRVVREDDGSLRAFQQ